MIFYKKMASVNQYLYDIPVNMNKALDKYYEDPTDDNYDNVVENAEKYRNNLYNLKKYINKPVLIDIKKRIDDFVDEEEAKKKQAKQGVENQDGGRRRTKRKGRKGAKKSKKSRRSKKSKKSRKFKTSRRR